MKPVCNRDKETLEMKRPMNHVLLLMLMMLGAWTLSTYAQVPAPAEMVDDWRYQFMAHDFTVDGVEQEVYIKLDSFTGRTWRFSISNPKWILIPEQQNGRGLSASNEARYELFAHNYEDKNGEPQEVILRTDAVSGYSWMYRGSDGGWREIGQVD
jgi:hypothetical protein